ncbi:MAG: Fic family protein [Acholeplasmataceae bacterium]|jgi:Fic family protein|nr:Fic family protein [Acholeplasmataceae bacterium]
MEYTPPFEITKIMLDKVSSIMKNIGKLDNYKDLNKMPVLRKNNRIHSIHSSLAIEANSLSFNQVKDIIDGKTVVGPQNEIKEVKNAYNAYKLMDNINPYSIKDLKSAHRVMMDLIMEKSGEFRKGHEGVFDENGNCIHVCPPPEQLNLLISKLFKWMKENKDTLHPLILSSVFHYEFVFIHPFSDGNGRIARLWQNVILSKFEEIFEYVPIETQIKKYQKEYYDAINFSNKSGNSTVFIEFMLKMIDETILDLLKNTITEANRVSLYVKKLLAVMEIGVELTTTEMMSKLGLKSRVSFRENYLKPALESGLIKMTIPDKPTSKNQMYYKI